MCFLFLNKNGLVNSFQQDTLVYSIVGPFSGLWQENTRQLQPKLQLFAWRQGLAWALGSCSPRSPGRWSVDGEMDWIPWTVQNRWLEPSFPLFFFRCKKTYHNEEHGRTVLDLQFDTHTKPAEAVLAVLFMFLMVERKAIGWWLVGGKQESVCKGWTLYEGLWYML